MKQYDVLILGGGRAALSAAESAREQSPSVRIAMVSAERLPPYVRPMLTKLPLDQYDGEKTLIHPAQWYDEHQIDLYLQTQILSLDAARRQVQASRGCFQYSACVYALGAYNFVPPFSGRELEGVCTLRTDQDIYALRRAALRARSAVVIGGGVIGLEAAYQLAEHGCSVTVLETAPYLMPRLLDEASARELERQITRFTVHTGVKVLGMTGEGRVEAVEAASMEPIPADLVVISCGVRANTAIAQAAGLDVERGVVVDEWMKTSIPDVYACGDCAEYQGVNTGLWAQAKAQGAVAGANAVGGAKRYHGSDAALLLSGPEFSVYSVGDMGKNLNLTYTDRNTYTQRQQKLEVNTRKRSGYIHEFFTDGRLAGAFLLGDLTKMQEKYREIMGECL